MSGPVGSFATERGDGTESFKFSTAVLGRSSQSRPGKWLIGKDPVFKFFFCVPKSFEVLTTDSWIANCTGISEQPAPALWQVAQPEDRELPFGAPIMAAFYHD